MCNKIERLRRLTDSDRKWNQLSGEMIPAQRVRAVIALVFTSIEKRVSSREERQALVDDLWVFLGIRPEPMALPEGADA